MYLGRVDESELRGQERVKHWVKTNMPPNLGESVQEGCITIASDEELVMDDQIVGDIGNLGTGRELDDVSGAWSTDGDIGVDEH